MEVIDYTPPHSVAKMLRSDTLVTAIMGPFGSGKSVGCVMGLLKRAMEQEPNSKGVRQTRFALIRNTFRMLEDTTKKTVFEWLPPGAAGRYLSTKNQFVLEFALADGTRVESEWLFRALDTPDDAKNLLSMELTGAWVNEYRDIDEEIFINLIGRVGRYPARHKSVPPTWFGILMDTNPPPTSSFWYRFFEEGISEELTQTLAAAMEAAGAPLRPLAELFKQPSGMSPEAENAENLPPGYYATLMALNTDKSPEWVRVHVHGEYGYVQDGLPVYPEFREATHVAKEPLRPVRGMPLTVGIDFGLTPAAVVFQQTAKGQWIILAELISENMGMERFSDLLRTMLVSRFPDNPEVQIWGDPAGQQRAQTDEKTCFQVLRGAGFTIRPGPSDLVTRLGAVRRVLNRMLDGDPGLLVDPSCKVLIRGFLGEYRYRVIRGQNQRYDEVPEKNSVSHVHDAFQHSLGVFEGPPMRGLAARKWGKHHVEGRVQTRPAKWKVYG